MSYSFQDLPELQPLIDSLTELHCHFQNLAEIPTFQLPDTLTWLSCHNNRLTRLVNDERSERGERLPNSLTHLYCFTNRLTRLPERLPNNLTVLWSSNNRLTKLPEQLPNTLTVLDCRENLLTKLPKHLPNSLTDLYYSRNPFLFNLKNNLKWYNINIFSFNNYKVLGILQRKIPKMWKLNFCRDISRECSRY